MKHSPKKPAKIHLPSRNMSILSYRKKYSSAKSFLTTKRLKRNSNNFKDSSKLCYLKKNVSTQCNGDLYLDGQNGGNETDVGKLVHVFVVRGSESSTQRRAWHIVLVEEDNIEAFQSKVKTLRTVELTDYGKVLYSGWGVDPPEHVFRNVRIEAELPSIKMDLRKLGLNCTAIKRIDTLER